MSVIEGFCHCLSVTTRGPDKAKTYDKGRKIHNGRSKLKIINVKITWLYVSITMLMRQNKFELKLIVIKERK